MGCAPTLTRDDGLRLAGLVEGEACFHLDRRSDGTYRCGFSLVQRLDRRERIDRLVAMTGLGVARTEAGRKGAAPVRVWRVETMADCRALVELLHDHPLDGAKAGDYAIWAEAVRLWTDRERGDSWAPLAALHRVMQQGKLFAWAGTLPAERLDELVAEASV